MADLSITTEIVGLNATLSGMKSIGDSATGIGAGFAKVGEQLKSLGQTLSLSVTAPLTAFGTLGVKVAADFEAGMNKVAAISSATGQQLKSMTDLAIDLGAKTKFSASEAAEGMANLAAAGFDAEETMKALGPSMKLAEAAGVGLGEATRITGATLNQFNLDASELPRIGDLMVAASNRSAAGMLDLGEAFIKVGPLAKATDQSIEDMLAIIAKLSDAGVQGEVAGTALAAAIARLIEPPKLARQAIEDLNLKIKDGNGTMRSFVDILGDVDKAGASAEQIIALFGIEAGRYLISIKGSAEETRKFSADLSTAGGEMDRVAGIMNKGITYQLEQLKGAFESLAIRIGQAGILEELTKLAAGASAFIDELSKSSPELLAWGAHMGALAAVIGPAAIALGGFLAALRPIGLAIGAMTGPIGLAAIAVAALITAFDGWDEIGAAVSGAWDAIGRFVTDVQSAFADLVSNSDSTSESVGLAIGAMAGAIAVGASKALDAMGTLADDLLAMFDRAMADGDWASAAGQAVDAVSDAMAGMWDAVSPSIDAFVKGLLDGFDRATGGDIRRTFDEFVSWVGEAAGRMADGFVDGFKGVVDRVAAAWDDIKETIRRKVGEIAEVIPAPVRTAMDTVTSTIETGIDKASGVLSSTTEAMGRVWTQGLDFFGITTGQAMQDGVIAPMEEMQREVVGQSIIPDTVAMILESWRGLMEMTPLTERAVSEQIAGFEALKQQIAQWGNDVRTIMGDQTLTVDDQKAKLAELRAAMEEMGVTGTDAYRRVLEAQKDLASQTPTILEGMKQGWVSYYNEVTNLGKTAAEATTQGLRTVESTLSEFFKTGKLNFTSLKDFAIQTYADMAAQATMSMVVQSGNAFKEWLFGAQTSATGVQTAVEGSMTGAAAATTGFGTQAQGVFSGLWEFVTAGFGGMLTSITGILGGLLTFFTDLLTQIGGLFSSLWTSIVEGASALMGSLGELLGGLGTTVGGVVDTVGGLFGGLWDTITTAGGGAMDLIGGAIDLFGGNSASVMDTVSTGWSTLFGGMGTTATDTLGVVNSGIDLTGVTFGETMGGMTVASDATFDGLGTVADYTFGSMGGAAIDMGTTASGAMAGAAASGASSFLGLSQSAIGSISAIGTVISAVGVGASMFFDGLSSQTSGAIGAIGGVATALASLAAGNPLGVIAGAVAALQGAAAAFGGSTHDNYSVNIGKTGQISTGTNTNPNPEHQKAANAVANEVAKYLQSKGISERAEVRVDDRGTVIKLQTGNDEFSRTANDPAVALAQFKSHIDQNPGHWAGKADGGLVLGGIPWSMPGSRDNILAPLQTGEFVVRREATRQFHPLLDAINRGQVTSRTLGGLAQAGIGMPGATVGPNVVGKFFDELDGAWTTLADQADTAFGAVTSTVEQWRETGAAKVAEFAASSKAHLDELAPKSVEVFAGMGETLRLWAEDGSTRLTEFVATTGERLGELVPLTDETMKLMGETLVAWIDDGLLGWDAYATGVTASHDLVAEHHAMRVGEMGLGWTETTTRMGADQARLEAATTASYRSVGAYATTTLTAINTAFAAMVAAAVARLAQLRAEAGATIGAINGEIATAEANIARARAEAASIPAPASGYDKDRGFATGGDAVFTSPTRIMVAEQGPERISARPLGRGRGTGSGQTLVFQGPVIANDLSMTQLARRLMREVEREQQRRR